ncbi:NAD(P)-dependent oxidoreductase [Terrarubrum flagellatum]|uniref:NAD(P)-dependent oxidoreductase n=1 Tax=Terrirubrum flagellatum TaxID=2895980 RepID=UPI00314506C0
MSGSAWEKGPDIAAGRLAEADYAANFADLHPAFDKHEAIVASERCLYCYDAPCMNACPTKIDIPLFIRQIANANALGAAKTILDANIMGGMCARVCPTETLCEEACVREHAEGMPVEIGRLQRYATDALFKTGKQIYKQDAPTGFKIAVVGAGPAGLSCAHALARQGHAVTIFEARPKAGGLNEYGIAAYKTVDEFAAREVDYILGVGGIAIEYGSRLGDNLKLADLRAKFDAVFLSIGLGGVNALGVDHAGVKGVEDAVAFIARLRQTKDKSEVAIGRRVVVVGGGMTAIDMASQAKRLGAEEVTIVYRRDAAAMKASDFEQELAQTDGVLIRHWLRPVGVKHANGHVSGVELAYTRDENGKLVDDGRKLALDCDQLFLAIGQTLLGAEIGDGALTLEGGRIKIDVERKTSLDDVWAGGDCVAGGQDLTVAAVEDGKQAAISIGRGLKSRVSVAA